MDEGSFISIGGRILGDNHCFHPTGETIIFLFAGHNVTKRIQIENLLASESKLFLTKLLNIISNKAGTSRLSGQLFPSSELLTLINEKIFRPEYRINFPASKLETPMEWDDLALPFETHEDLEEL